LTGFLPGCGRYPYIAPPDLLSRLAAETIRLPATTWSFLGAGIILGSASTAAWPRALLWVAVPVIFGVAFAGAGHHGPRCTGPKAFW
jgi:ABC-2 type transport system permease protein